MAVAPNYAVARDSQADGVTRVRQTNRANRPRVPYDLGELSVGRRRAGRDLPQRVPDLLLERSATAVDRDAVERPKSPEKYACTRVAYPLGSRRRFKTTSGNRERVRASIRDRATGKASAQSASSAATMVSVPSGDRT